MEHRRMQLATRPPEAEQPTYLFGVEKALIAGIHLLPLPGSPGYDRLAGMRPVVQRARDDVRILTEHGFDALLFANEADVPYVQRLGPETVAAFAEAVAIATQDVSVPFGLNVLLDPVAGLGIAHATGASFIRGYFAGGYVSDVGIMDTRGPEALRLRSNLGAGQVRLYHNLVCAFGAPFVDRPKGEEAYGARVHAGVDGFTISGRAAGYAPRPETFREVRQAVPEVPLIVGTGASAANVEALLEVADGAIVVSSLRQDGRTLNAIDPRRVREFMVAASRATGR